MHWTLDAMMRLHQTFGETLSNGTSANSTIGVLKNWQSQIGFERDKSSTRQHALSEAVPVRSSMCHVPSLSLTVTVAR